MTIGDELPQDVQAFVGTHLESYEHLQLLLLLSRDRDTPWTLEALTSRLHIPAQLAVSALASLQVSGLVQASKDMAQQHYEYAPAGAALDRTVAGLVSEYEAHPARIIGLMSANAIERVRRSALRTFADAFLFKKDKDG